MGKRTRAIVDLQSSLGPALASGHHQELPASLDAIFRGRGISEGEQLQRFPSGDFFALNNGALQLQPLCSVCRPVSS